MRRIDGGTFSDSDAHPNKSLQPTGAWEHRYGSAVDITTGRRFLPRYDAARS